MNIEIMVTILLAIFASGGTYLGVRLNNSTSRQQFYEDKITELLVRTESALKEAQQRIETLELELDMTENEKDAVKTELNSARREIVSLQQVISELRDKLTEVKSKIKEENTNGRAKKESWE
ncbi:hypothetical protein Q9933_002247 [Listeria monocytogenes]|uniref:Uncharacterized protein n=1 Tax=Listeria monocytogenes TaxID=1639 RepID=A0A6W8GU25_LISMN|nr:MULTISPECIES: hypothetical protein [Listeria]EAC2919012.1 hypothetical protein [Listeria monocytogenes]EAD5378888.1 hypothetical protein [Listeria monocytogenes]EAD5382291.1 hypothetical protein [Listeria monocytogenes]EAD5844390.1 hypothetical protein [Listeria monocytogenes]EAD5983821.1 hypothetical protein [Listeria monocytogenes]